MRSAAARISSVISGVIATRSDPGPAFPRSGRADTPSAAKAAATGVIVASTTRGGGAPVTPVYSLTISVNFVSYKSKLGVWQCHHREATLPLHAGALRLLLYTVRPRRALWQRVIDTLQDHTQPTGVVDETLLDLVSGCL